MQNVFGSLKIHRTNSSSEISFKPRFSSQSQDTTQHQRSTSFVQLDWRNRTHAAHVSVMRSPHHAAPSAVTLQSHLYLPRRQLTPPPQPPQRKKIFSRPFSKFHFRNLTTPPAEEKGRRPNQCSPDRSASRMPLISKARPRLQLPSMEFRHFRCAGNWLWMNESRCALITSSKGADMGFVSRKWVRRVGKRPQKISSTKWH